MFTIFNWLLSMLCVGRWIIWRVFDSENYLVNQRFVLKHIFLLIIRHHIDWGKGNEISPISRYLHIIKNKIKVTFLLFNYYLCLKIYINTSYLCVFSKSFSHMKIFRDNYTCVSDIRYIIATHESCDVSLMIWKK